MGRFPLGILRTASFAVSQAAESSAEQSSAAQPSAVNTGNLPAELPEPAAQAVNEVIFWWGE